MPPLENRVKVTDTAIEGDSEWKRMRIGGIAHSQGVDGHSIALRIDGLADVESPHQRSGIDEDRSVGDVLTGADSPSETELIELHLLVEFAIRSEEPVKLEVFHV